MHAQVKDNGWPTGPSTLDELFRWPEFNSHRLLADLENSAEIRENFRALSQHSIHITDSYSGMGTASVMLHLQFDRMMSWEP